MWSIIVLMVLSHRLLRDDDGDCAVAAVSAAATASPLTSSLDELLALGDVALSEEDLDQALMHYQQGIQLWHDSDEVDDAVVDSTRDSNSLFSTLLSLYTNYGTALSTTGKNEEAAQSYQNAINLYKQQTMTDHTDNKLRDDGVVTEIAAQAAFYLGMVYQDMGLPRDAVDAYTYAHTLDPMHWASMANLGSVLHDDLSDHGRALLAYNKAYTLLTDTSQRGQGATDPPPEPRFILSQLQYRIGLCIFHDLTTQRCVLQDDPTATPVDCKELATHAFALAVDYDNTNESAKHMLATITADSTMKRASNDYVKSLFDDYASNFEHSLVQELGYNGYERLRRGFDRAFLVNGDGEPPPTMIFDRVVDAGCGTGLVGEQFRNVSRTLIGADLSDAILQQAVAARPGLYDEVVVGDVTEVFRAQKPIALIVAADSYIYFGDLDPLFQSMWDGLGDNGYAAFTLENVGIEDEETLAASKPDWRWQLTASGRFAHRKDYVVATGQQNGLNLVHYEPLDGFRHEKGVPVRGHVFVMKKTSEQNGEL
jgi:predicted TPR repeat methyltransferase/tetratricopeptide (TPR) repeat protein